MNEKTEPLSMVAVDPLVMREGYCCDCKNNPVDSIVDAARIPGHPCNGCWFHDDKSNWEARDE